MQLQQIIERGRQKYFITVNTGKQRILTEERVNGALHKLYPRELTLAGSNNDTKSAPPAPRLATTTAAGNNTHSDDNALNDLEAPFKMIRKWEY